MKQKEGELEEEEVKEEDMKEDAEVDQLSPFNALVSAVSRLQPSLLIARDGNSKQIIQFF